MKMYFKSYIGNVQMMLDSDTMQVLEICNNSNENSVNNIMKESFYNMQLTNSQDSSKWQVSTEESFNEAKANVIASL